ncbi:MAG: PIG-L family deacetylase [Armatimonadetes bacterium]|nr:PIG-L family deacetylase [Armatimonadota bacterium]
MADAGQEPQERNGTVPLLGAHDSILAIGAHFDDVELGCGGVLAKAASRGCHITILVMTSSSYTHARGEIVRTAEAAYDEGVAAAATLGVTDVRCLGLGNMNLRWEGDTVAAIEAIMEEVRPAIIFTHWPFDTHQDHHYGSLATLSAARYFSSILMYDPMFPSGRSYHPFRPQVYFDITDTLDAKIAALRCHASELRKYGDNWLDAVTARARYRGYETGAQYAEAFEAVRLQVRL